MKGCRPLTTGEIAEVSKAFSGPFAARDKALFIVGTQTGFRISELLSLKVGDIYQYGKISDMVSVSRAHMKKKVAGRTMVLNIKAKEALRPWLKQLEKMGRLHPNTPLFLSKKLDADGKLKAISRVQAWRVLDMAYKACELAGKTGTHSMRKSFADRLYSHFKGDIAKIAKGLGHKNINSTMSYLSFKEQDIFDCVINM
jgi:integrase